MILGGYFDHYVVATFLLLWGGGRSVASTTF